jgi:transposase-like protein
MLVEHSVVEQRYLAVKEALDTGATITDVARRHGVDRRTVHRWLLRYSIGDLGALADRSSKPDRCPHLFARPIPRPLLASQIQKRAVLLRRDGQKGHP